MEATELKYYIYFSGMHGICGLVCGSLWHAYSMAWYCIAWCVWYDGVCAWIACVSYGIVVLCVWYGEVLYGIRMVGMYTGIRPYNS